MLDFIPSIGPCVFVLLISLVVCSINGIAIIDTPFYFVLFVFTSLCKILQMFGEFDDTQVMQFRSVRKLLSIRIVTTLVTDRHPFFLCDFLDFSFRPNDDFVSIQCVDCELDIFLIVARLVVLDVASDDFSLKLCWVGEEYMLDSSPTLFALSHVDISFHATFFALNVSRGIGPNSASTKGMQIKIVFCSPLKNKINSFCLYIFVDALKLSKSIWFNNIEVGPFRVFEVVVWKTVIVQQSFLSSYNFISSHKGHRSMEFGIMFLLVFLVALNFIFTSSATEGAFSGTSNNTCLFLFYLVVILTLSFNFCYETIRKEFEFFWLFFWSWYFSVLVSRVYDELKSFVNHFNILIKQLLSVFFERGHIFIVIWFFIRFSCLDLVTK